MLSIVAPTVQPQVEPNCRCLDTGTGIRTIYIRQIQRPPFSSHTTTIVYNTIVTPQVPPLHSSLRAISS